MVVFKMSVYILFYFIIRVAFTTDNFENDTANSIKSSASFKIASINSTTK